MSEEHRPKYFKAGVDEVQMAEIESRVSPDEFDPQDKANIAWLVSEVRRLQKADVEREAEHTALYNKLDDWQRYEENDVVPLRKNLDAICARIADNPIVKWCASRGCENFQKHGEIKCGECAPCLAQKALGTFDD